MPDEQPPPPHHGAEPGDAEFLHALGARLRLLRARRGVTRRDLAARSRVSERHIAQFEAGTGNISVLLLRRIARALGVGVETLAAERPEGSAERALLEQAVAALPESDLAEANGRAVATASRSSACAAPASPRSGR
jgi:XRE family aerobic/anaerobic benzoate catabolism transcriptional regulator